MFGIGGGELVIIAIVVLLAVGPTRMPTMMRAVGRALREFRKATQELRAQSGIDDLLREDFNLDPRKGSSKRPAPRGPLGAITDEVLEAERPHGGVDVDWERKHGETATKEPGKSTEPKA